MQQLGRRLFVQEFTGFNASCPFFNGATRLTVQPATGDILVIPVSCTIALSGNLSVTNQITFDIYGQLSFPTSGDKVIFNALTVINVYSGGSLYGVSNSNQIRVGAGSADWSGPGLFPGPFSINQSGITVLPVELLNFSVEQKGHTASINWQTATEKNNNYFDVERSVDGINFELVKRIKSKADNAGNSSFVLDYSYTDGNPLEGVSYYRLIQVDKDSKFEIFNMISFSLTKDTYEKIQFKIYPNPNDGNFLVDVGGIENNHTVEVKIVDILGKIIFEELTDVFSIKNKEFAINLKNKFPSGNYTSIFSLEEVKYHSIFIIN